MKTGILTVVGLSVLAVFFVATAVVFCAAAHSLEAEPQAAQADGPVTGMDCHKTHARCLKSDAENPKTGGQSVVVVSPPQKDFLDIVNISAATMSAVGTLVSALGTLVAAGFAWVATKQANEAARQAQQTAAQSSQAARQAEKTARDQRLAELFGEFQSMEYLDPDKLVVLNVQNKTPEQKAIDDEIGRKVVTNLNTMDKIGFCWEKNLVDRPGVEEIVRPFFTKLYEQIASLPHIESLNRNGRKLVGQSLKATALYQYLR